MPYITSFETLEQEIEKVPGKPVVLEALWDGDTNGWFLYIDLYTETGRFFWKKTTAVHLGIISMGGDIRLFNGQVPAWPEAVLAKAIGEKAAEKYGLTFYFPSDKEPDDNCPSWTQRHLAINCADCNKLILPTNSPYLPKEICHHCHLEREWNEKIKLNKPYKDGIYGTYRTKDNPDECRDHTIVDYLKTLKALDAAIIIFTHDELIAIKDNVYNEIKQLIANYKPSDLQGESRKFGAFKTLSFEDRDYEIEMKFGHAHWELYSQVYRYRTLEEAVLNGWTYYLHIVKGITDRDDAFLRFVYAVCNGETSIQAINDRYRNILTAAEVLATLENLATLNCINILNQTIHITERGKNIL
ncbi:hypothetical protein SAMN04488505_11033 [Chitinophaga rupis]|uniref:Uncharacterized protein n=1 Tax=Chitinophaga rupis TaxID=573321 RepID=A0A1H8G516_9BACT|nr:hypothetical protein [Chitinophaga rupis]SEN38855.1 hypothetical protein SAMN04488505_11033 [Chitinophaga rupis]